MKNPFEMLGGETEDKQEKGEERLATREDIAALEQKFAPQNEIFDNPAEEDLKDLNEKIEDPYPDLHDGFFDRGGMESMDEGKRNKQRRGK